MDICVMEIQTDFTETFNNVFRRTWTDAEELL